MLIETYRNIGFLEGFLNILMHATEDGIIKTEATFDQDMVWLFIDQMAELF